MRLLQACWRILRVVSLLAASGVDFLVRPPRSPAEAGEKIHRYCNRIVRALGVSLDVEGSSIPHGAVISNHLSYLDILIYAAIQPFVMVAKADVRSWPGIGWITRKAGTVYVVRGGGPATYPAVNRAMAEAYRSGLPVLFFPEGTTTDGSEVLPFRRGLFHSILNEGVALQTASLHYTSGDSTVSIANDVCWWGDALLAPHLWRLVQADEIRATVRFGRVVEERDDRFILSHRARQQVIALYDELSFAGESAVATVHEPQLVEAL